MEHGHALGHAYVQYISVTVNRPSPRLSRILCLIATDKKASAFPGRWLGTQGSRINQGLPLDDGKWELDTLRAEHVWICFYKRYPGDLGGSLTEPQWVKQRSFHTMVLWERARQSALEKSPHKRVDLQTVLLVHWQLGVCTLWVNRGVGTWMWRMGMFLETQRSWQREGLAWAWNLLIIVCAIFPLPEQGGAGGGNATLGFGTAGGCLPWRWALSACILYPFPLPTWLHLV